MPYSIINLFLISSGDGLIITIFGFVVLLLKAFLNSSSVFKSVLGKEYPIIKIFSAFVKDSSALYHNFLNTSPNRLYSFF